MKKNYLAGLVSLAFGVLAFFDGVEGGGTAPAQEEGFVPAEELQMESTEGGMVEETVIGELAPPAYGAYNFETRLENAINAGIGDTGTDNPGRVVVEEFTRWLGENGIEPSLFSALAEDEKASSAVS